ncbi:hypothetical protein HHO41_14335 [Bacillus sp. DNRA2]|uniref:hypothetical protein n=1 Tax=Bacillus sp. DNRA2 TaxID=2723053 RepID=UPI00145EE61D|nr:hypothetical protein [Bacillus sp. DNRA2]NMD71481.1 hypothetical protein [Bacillus sp. DNRA2]
MNPVQMIQSLFQNENLQKDSLLSLKQGQLLNGRIEKFLPNDMALIRMGDKRLVATLKADLSADESYWFEVRSVGKDGLELKVIAGIQQTGSEELFLNSQQLPDTKQNVQLIQFLLSKNLPVSKEQLQLAASWINSRSDATKELTALEWMITKGLPFTKTTFQSLVAVQETQPLYQQLEELRSQLDNPAFASLKSIQPLKDMISSILQNHSIDDVKSTQEVKQLLKQLIQSLGLHYENEVGSKTGDKEASAETLRSLKQLVLTSLTELGSNGKLLEPLLNRLTGLQLVSQDLSGPMQQIVMQLPFVFAEKKSDVTLQWSGRKISNGQIDPNYCRVLFYLDLKSLNHTVVDMQVQNKVIHLSITNDSPEIEQVVKSLTPTLKQKLVSIGYTLSFIQVSHPTLEKRKMKPQQINPVDLSLGQNVRVDTKI